MKQTAKRSKHRITARQRRYIRLLGVVLFGLSLFPFALLVSAHGPIAAILLAGGVAVIGLILSASPELIALAFDLATWLP